MRQTFSILIFKKLNCEDNTDRIHYLQMRLINVLMLPIVLTKLTLGTQEYSFILSTEFQKLTIRNSH